MIDLSGRGAGADLAQLREPLHLESLLQGQHRDNEIGNAALKLAQWPIKLSSPHIEIRGSVAELEIQQPASLEQNYRAGESVSHGSSPVVSSVHNTP